MHATSLTLSRGASLLACALLALTGARAPGADQKPPSDAFPEFDSYIKVTGQAASVTGDGAAYARRFQSPENGAYGIEALHYNKDTGKTTTVQLDGRALSGAEDYLGKFRLVKTDLGTFEVGYKRFRTFYDGIGGFFPLGNTWLPLGQPELHTDRASFWADVTIAKEGAPVFHLRYENDLRSGRKDTTIWGDTDFTGIPISSVSAQNPYSSNRKIIPAFIDLNERQKTWTASLKHTVGKTEFEFEIVRNDTDSLDTRYQNRYPGELKPFPAIPALPAKIIAPALANNFITGFDRQGVDSKITAYTGKFETKASEQLTFFGGLSYQHAAAEISGDREMTLFINTGAGVVAAVGGFTANGRPPYSYTTLFGHTKENTLTGNLGLSYKPVKDLFLSLALKGEQIDMDGVNQVTYINTLIVQSTGQTTSIPVAAPNVSARTEKSWIPELNVRYTGIKNLSLYGAFDYRHSPGDVSGTSTGVTPAGSTILQSIVSSSDNVQLNHGHYKVGANWNASSMVTLRAEVYYKDHRNSLTGVGTSSGSQFIMGYQFYGTKLTAIVKPLPTLTFTTRYVRQSGRSDVTVDYGQSYDSMDSKNHLLGETIDWNPTKQFYLQANVNVVYATIQTAYPRAGGTANDVLRNADNNYWNGSFVAGFVLAKNTDAQLEYTVSRADNFNPAIVVSQPYGASYRESMVTAGLKQRFSDRWMGQIKAGYFDHRSDTTGNRTNFRGPVGYVSLDYAL